MTTRDIFTPLLFVIGLLCVSLLSLSSAYAQITTVPLDLEPGDPYRLVFITREKSFTAVSSNISDYDAWVTEQANTSSELVAVGTTWRVIGSTSSVSAKVHTGTDDSPTGLNGVPIYRLDGVRIADNYDDLWDGGIQNPLYVAQDGTVLDTCCGTWTGTGGLGNSVLGNELGAAGESVVDGAPNGTGGNWIETGPFPASEQQYLYAISGVLVDGQSTTAFSADGVVESTSGGFKFPDGTVQMTAAAAAGDADIIPAIDSIFDLGSFNNRWSRVHAMDAISQRASISDVLSLGPGSPPTDPQIGDIYVDADTNELCFWNGAWQALVTGTDGNCN